MKINYTFNFMSFRGVSNILCSFIPPGSQSERNLRNILSIDANCNFLNLEIGNRGLLEGKDRR